jgi:hypothetical protein
MGNPLPSRLLIMTPGLNGYDKPLGPICPLKIMNGQSCTCLTQTLDFSLYQLLRLHKSIILENHS